MLRFFQYIFLSMICLCAVGQESAELESIFAEINQIQEKYQQPNPIYQGQHPERFSYIQAMSKVLEADELKPLLQRLEDLTATSLTEQQEINREIRILQLRDQIAEVSFETYLIPFNSEGGFFNRPSFFLSNLPFETASDYQDYLNWLPSFAEYLFYNQKLLRQGIEEGIQAPKVIVMNAVALLQPWTTTEVSNHPFYQPFHAFPTSVEPKAKAVLIAKAKRVISNEIIPAYQKLEQFFKEEYLTAAPEKVGISEITNGSAYYENRVRHFTTLDMTPDSVFNIGKAEVARIRALMEDIVEELGYEGTFADFIQFLRTDPQFYPSSGQELLNYAAWLSKKAEGQLPALFSKLYELPFTVAPVPADIAPNYTGGRYVGGSKRLNRPGTYWVNTYNLPSRTLYTLPALTLHEAVPGHHLQIQIASELEGLPDFRSGYYISAFGEGWGLYAEYLGEEMGMYETPYDLFGRYTYEMWRACRLVVDVGMHYKGWTREQAVAFMSENTALSLHEVNTEIDRYIGWPGQALSYKIGELTIKRLRTQAEEALKDDFNIQEFHQVVLRNGAIPLSMLEKQVQNYITSKKAK